MVLLCARGAQQIFSDESLYHIDSKRVRKKVLQNEPKTSCEKTFWTLHAYEVKYICCLGSQMLYNFYVLHFVNEECLQSSRFSVFY